MSTDPRRSSPAALRNREPILVALRAILPSAGTVIEVASGSGEHVVYFAKHFPNLLWQPSDPAAEARASIAGWIADEGLPNILLPLPIDAMAPDWPIAHADAVLAINMVHISPWAATLGLLRGAARLLPSNAPLFLYGPFQRDGEAMSLSNAAFDADLRLRNSEWGIRLLEDVVHEAEKAGFELARVMAMPANNLSVILLRK
ncbi:DUF938 domain-containing protein [Sphingomonas sp. BIUV-7]|uniref:DUF938 domain-containing protein n=2 Tax=Sphingomonas natans TaxID=3063330 RepID=A0ABT8Y7K1_9SPHN|nr:DUF938 domain-containing protein [Sphingomonas sp. BIUV-7]MDO6414296.1 DUF938 domain-containing protein [Sphingomonas sp. BIUV-7]